MAGHSHWKQIQHKKGTADQKRGQLFSKLLNAVTIAARDNPDPQFNPRLRRMIEKARLANVPNENIERAIKRSNEAQNLEEVVIEAYGPEKSALIIYGITDSKNRTVAEVRALLNERGVKTADPGSVLWAFDQPAHGGAWQPKFIQPISENSKKKIQELIQVLENRDDVQKVITNVQ